MSDRFEFTWHGQARLDLEDAIRDDLDNVMFTPDEHIAEDMVFHNYWLTDDMNGPCVCVWGVEGDDRLHAELHGHTSWVDGNGNATDGPAPPAKDQPADLPEPPPHEQ